MTEPYTIDDSRQHALLQQFITWLDFEKSIYLEKYSSEGMLVNQEQTDAELIKEFQEWHKRQGL